MKNRLKVSTIAIFATISLFVMGSITLAISIFPPEIQAIIDLLGPGGICASKYIGERAQLALFMVLGGLVLISVIYALLAAFKYIRSEGNPDKMEDAQKSIKAIFFGIAAMIIAIVGIVLVFAVFNATPTNPEIFQTCLQASDSEGCKACRKSTNDPLCKICEDSYDVVCKANQGKNVKLEDIIGDLADGRCKPVKYNN